MYTLREDLTREAVISRTRKRLYNRTVNDGARERYRRARDVDPLLGFHCHIHKHEGVRTLGDAVNAGRVSHKTANAADRYVSPKLHLFWGRIPLGEDP